MECFGEDDYVRRSPGLEPVFPTLECVTPLIFDPLWLPQDIANTLLVIETLCLGSRVSNIIVGSGIF